MPSGKQAQAQRLRREIKALRQQATCQWQQASEKWRELHTLEQEVIGEQLQEGRKRRNLTLEDLSAATGVRVQYLEQIEAGKAPGLTIDTYLNIRNALKAGLVPSRSPAGDKPHSEEK